MFSPGFFYVGVPTFNKLYLLRAMFKYFCDIRMTGSGIHADSTGKLDLLVKYQANFVPKNYS
tara:strand:- start:732 stop:917 length:186 start_codon:yes stop_codon:yes gene_type:complete